MTPKRFFRGILATSGFPIGQATATDGKSDTSGFTGNSIMQYDNGTATKGQGIKCTFENGMLKTVQFASST